MKRSFSFFASLASAVVLFSCSKKSETELTPTPPGGTNTGCDTVNMKFATNIKPILQNNCYACHSNANFSISGIKLEEYADLKTHVSDGDVMGTITHAAGYPAMPQGGPKLSDCDINKIKAWIDRGAPNN